MIVIFPTNGLQNVIEKEYRQELYATESLKIEHLLFDFDSFVDGDIKKAFRNIKKQYSEQKAIYRGWMMSTDQYETFFIELLKYNIILINSPFEYDRAHCLYTAYDIIKDYTPFSTFILEEDFNDESLEKALEPFHGKSVFFRDFYKSEKFLWETASFIPDGSDIKKVKEIINGFKEFRSIKRGYVFREFITLSRIGKHPLSNIPISNEWRIYFLNNKVIDIFPYWEDGNYVGVQKPSLDKFIDIGKKIDSSFFTMDIAKTDKGQWIIIELGDGQVSSLMRDCDHERFYRKLGRDL